MSEGDQVADDQRHEFPFFTGAVEERARQLTDAYLDAFKVDALSLKCFPRSPAVTKWWTDMLAEEVQDDNSFFSASIATDKGDGSRYLSAFAKWNLPQPIQAASKQSLDDKRLLELAEATLGRADERELVAVPNSPGQHHYVDRKSGHIFALDCLSELPQWPEGVSSDHDAANSFFSLLLSARRAWEASLSPDEQAQGYYYLEMLGTSTRHRGEKLGKKHLRWGIERARAEKILCYVEASPSSVDFYASEGFVALGKVQVMLDGQDFYNLRMVLTSS